MIRISTIFIAICMVLVAASLGLVLHAVAGFSGTESAIVALTALTFLILYNAVSMRLRDRSDVGGQIADLSRGTADLARQVAEFGRRLAADRGPGGVGELGQLRPHPGRRSARSTNSACWSSNWPSRWRAMRICWPRARRPRPPPRGQAAFRTGRTTGDRRRSKRRRRQARAGCRRKAGAFAAAAEAASPSRSQPQLLAAVKNAVEESRLDIYLQPMVTLPQRKVRFYEAVTRLRDDKDQILAADDFIAIAEAGGLIGKIDHMVMLRCVQVLRRLMVRNKDVGVFCNVSAATLGNPANFAQCLDFLEANRALAPSFVLEFKQATFRHLGPTEIENLAALSQRGYRFSIDHVTDLRIEPRDLADRGVRFIKVPAALLLDPKQSSTSDIHPSDLSDLLGRFGIDLIAEKIEGERAVVDLLDYDVRFGQGFLFAPPRPLRPEGASATGGATPNKESGSSQWLQQHRSHRQPGRRAPPCGRPAMPRWRAAPQDRANRLPNS